mmetsp:Transcript_5472/g.6019  ORF Transcript_5472/g.6019 Transcript_5472/m.6019 type:complete len:99 (-) Transcript_5472:392-688(-)
MDVDTCRFHKEKNRSVSRKKATHTRVHRNSTLQHSERFPFSQTRIVIQSLDPGKLSEEDWCDKISGDREEIEENLNESSDLVVGGHRRFGSECWQERV